MTNPSKSTKQEVNQFPDVGKMPTPPQNKEGFGGGLKAIQKEIEEKEDMLRRIEVLESKVKGSNRICPDCSKRYKVENKEGIEEIDLTYWETSTETNLELMVMKINELIQTLNKQEEEIREIKINYSVVNEMFRRIESLEKKDFIIIKCKHDRPSLEARIEELEKTVKLLQQKEL